MWGGGALRESLPLTERNGFPKITALSSLSSGGFQIKDRKAPRQSLERPPQDDHKYWDPNRRLERRVLGRVLMPNSFASIHDALKSQSALGSEGPGASRDLPPPRSPASHPDLPPRSSRLVHALLPAWKLPTPLPTSPATPHRLPAMTPGASAVLLLTERSNL